MKQLEPDFFVSGQIAPEDLPGLAAAGFTLLINNRPDGEEVDQPSAEAVRAAAERSGLDCIDIPVAQLTPEAVAQMAEALTGAGKTLAFCRSGTRSTYLWALARSGQGRDADALVQMAADAGYDLTPIRRFLR